MRGAGRPGWLDGSAAAFVLLALLVVVPMGIALWLATDAMATQSAAARQSVLESYRAQLRLVRARVDAHWRTFAARLDTGGSAEQRFAQLVLEGTADGAVLLDAQGHVAYPTAAGDPSAGARAVRDALDRLAAGAAGGRALQVAPLAARLNDYSRSMPASERLALMERLRAIEPNVVLPTEAALRLSLAMRGEGRPSPAPGHFQPTPLRDVWALASADGRVIALYWTGRIEAMMHDVLHEVAPAGIRFVTYPPDVEGDPEAIAAGLSLPGWQLTFQPLDRRSLDAAARQTAIGYAAITGGAVVVIAILGLAAGGVFQRHLRLARLKTDLVAAVSHELRTPLASMRVLVDGLLDDERLDPVKTREYLHLLSRENARLTRLIENFLAFSRLERGRHHFAFAPVHPADVAASAAGAIRERLPRDAVLHVDVAPDLPPLVADADALVTALGNLLDNALKYTPGDKRIDLRAYRGGSGDVVFAVGDNGIGIPPREQRRIFRRFYRVDQRLARETDGVGLGLSIVELIVRAHGGTVGVESAAGRGSVFTVRLPVAREGAAA
jgi:signal transduction histidine kinase